MRRLSRSDAEESIVATQAALDAGFPGLGVRVPAGSEGAIAVAARALGIPKMTLRSRIAPGGIIEREFPDIEPIRWPGLETLRDAETGALGFAPVLPGYAIKSTSTQFGSGGEVEKQWVQQHKARGEVFEVPDGQRVKGVSALVDAEGRAIQTWVKTEKDGGTLDMIEALRAVFDAYEGRGEMILPPLTVEDTLTVYPAADLHVGMYSWAPETGDDYDLAIVEELFIGKMRELVAKAPPSKTAIVLNLGDYFHADSRANRTEQSGAVLDVDSRYARVLQIGVRLMVECIELALTRHERVICRNLPGNHDYHSSLALTVALGAFFRGNPRVTIDSSPSKFFVYEFGKTLIAATHGDMAKAEALTAIVAARWPDEWGATRFRYGLTGHVHHKSKFGSEQSGMVVESFQTLSAKDFWHASMGYVAGRSLVAITYDRKLGECGRITAAVPAPERRAAA